MNITPLSDSERVAWWQLLQTDRVGPITFFKLIERYGTAARALEALPDLSRSGGRGTPLSPYPVARAEDDLAAILKSGARVIAACEPDYPDLLRQIDDAPPVIVVLGHTALFKKPSVGMVGARNASLPGRKMAFTLARDLGASGYTVVSGLARGIDTAAHEGALATGTIAVVAGGVDVIYPPENEKLYRQIAESGAIVSEHPMRTEPKSPYFPRRNRIISGLSRGTVVVEATVNSGSLITASCAAEQGRDVFAVPGSPLDPRAGGPNRLIRDGAVLVERADHITGHLALFQSRAALSDQPGLGYDAPTTEPDPTTLAATRAALLETLTYSPVTIDEVVRALPFHVQMVQIALLELELGGSLERLPGNRIVLIDKDILSERERSRHC